MLKALIKKQFYESFKSYFVNPKTGKARSKGAKIGLFVLFAFLMLFLCGTFFGVAMFLGGNILALGLDWLYFALMGLLSIAFGAFGSVFNTFSTLYISKDNELLLPMPIKPSTILISRMSLVYGLGLMYSAIVWLPAVVLYAVSGFGTVMGIILSALLCPVIALFVTVLTCILGWVVAIISTRVKNKSFITVILSLAFFGLYYYVCFNMEKVLEVFVSNAENIGTIIKVWANFIYMLGMGASGNILYMLLFTLITAILFAVCFYVLSKSFFKIITRTSGSVKKEYKKEKLSVNSLNKALLKKELKRFTSSPTYMLNAGLGIAIVPAVAVIALIKRATLNDALLQLSAEIPEIMPVLGKFLPLIILNGLLLMISLNAITAPSISLEGKNLWIYKTLPVNGADVLSAKLNLHAYLNIVPTVIGVVIIDYVFGFDMATTAISAIFACVYIYLTGAAGLIIGLLRPNFTWTNESVPIKQSLNVLFVWLFSIVIALAAVGLYYPLRNMVDTKNYLCGATVVIYVLQFLARKWLRTKGNDIFAKL